VNIRFHQASLKKSTLESEEILPSWSNGVNTSDDEFKRFEYGVPPEKNGDYAFLLHILTSLKSTGKAAVILPHGVLFRGKLPAVLE
jgi:type I restriction enzyme M protein